MIGNFLVPFLCTYAQLAEQEGVAAMWARHVEESTPEGGTPRGRWRAEAAAALAVLTGAEFARKPVRFICEVQMVLEQTYDVRMHMHEVCARRLSLLCRWHAEHTRSSSLHPMRTFGIPARLTHPHPSISLLPRVPSVYPPRAALQGLSRR
jgi:hypothetical protein